MRNRARMIVASFLAKDVRWTGAYFMRHLIGPVTEGRWFDTEGAYCGAGSRSSARSRRVTSMGRGRCPTTSRPASAVGSARTVPRRSSTTVRRGPPGSRRWPRRGSRPRAAEQLTAEQSPTATTRSSRSDVRMEVTRLEVGEA